MLHESFHPKPLSIAACTAMCQGRYLFEGRLRTLPFQIVYLPQKEQLYFVDLEDNKCVAGMGRLLSRKPNRLHFTGWIFGRAVELYLYLVNGDRRLRTMAFVAIFDGGQMEPEQETAFSTRE